MPKAGKKKRSHKRHSEFEAETPFAIPTEDNVQAIKVKDASGNDITVKAESVIAVGQNATDTVLYLEGGTLVHVAKTTDEVLHKSLSWDTTDNDADDTSTE